MLNRLTLLISIIALVFAVNSTVSAAVPSALLAAGSTRFAVVSAPVTSGLSTSSTSFVDLTGLAASISIPAGKSGDVFILFCADLYSGSSNVVARALIGSAVAAPGGVNVRAPSTLAETQCMNFYKTGVTSGSKTIKMQWKSAGGGMIQAHERSMIVILNLH